MTSFQNRSVSWSCFLALAVMALFISRPAFACKPIRLDNRVNEVFFEHEAVALSAESRAKVIALVAKAIAYNVEFAIITGFADVSEGNTEKVKKLSFARAEYVKSLALRTGFPTDRLFSENGRGNLPDAANNRRVELDIRYFPPGSCTMMVPR